jgi:hypothetical protein
VSELLQKGVFLLSIDTELAWGSVHNGAFPGRMGHYQKTRDVIRRLLELQERYEIRATWAIVGHLFLDQCRAEDGVKHPEITRPAYQWFAGDWFDADPGSDAETDPFWYGPDIVQQVQDCKAPQEIGCHGFSHMIVGDPGCSRECFDSEIRACVEQANKQGISLKSSIFPRNSVGHLDVLAEHGLSAFRGVTPAWHTRLPGPSRHLARLVDSILPIPPPVVTPKREGTMWDLPASYFYPHRDGWARAIPVGISIRKARRGLEKAAQQRSIFHLWFHPFNLASDPDGLLEGLEEIFKHVYRLREAGKLVNPSMGDLAESLGQTRPSGVLSSDRRSSADCIGHPRQSRKVSTKSDLSKGGNNIVTKGYFGVIGLGYVGLPLAIEFCRAGYHVVGVDVDEKRIAQLQAGRSYIGDIHSVDVESAVNEGLFFPTTDYCSLGQVEAMSICLPTPLRKTREPDVSYVAIAAERIAQTRMTKLREG